MSDLFIQNASSVATITNIANPSFTIPGGTFPLSPINDANGTHSGVNTPITVSLTTTAPVSLVWFAVGGVCLELSGCLTFCESGTKSLDLGINLDPSCTLFLTLEDFECDPCGGPIPTPTPTPTNLPNEICISSAGYTPINNTFTYNGPFNFRNQYIYDDGINIYEITWYPFNPFTLEPAQWIIFSSTVGFLYRSFEDVLTPDLASTWVEEDPLYFPPPIVTVCNPSPTPTPTPTPTQNNVIPTNELYLKLCSPTPYDVIIKPDVNINFNVGEVWFDSNNICWEVLSYNPLGTVTTSYTNWGTFTKHTNNDCSNCVSNYTSLVPYFPFGYDLFYSKDSKACIDNCGNEPPKPEPKPFICPSGVITLFPLDVKCNIVRQPTNNNQDGKLCLDINGGTKPYDITWTNSFQVDPCLENIGAGTYTATVTDYYGDFTVTTNCVVDSIIAVEVCFIYQSLECFGGSSSTIINEKITSSGVFNTKPYFIISNYYLYWEGSRWEFRTDFGSGTLISYLETTNDLPLGGNWVNLLGNPAITYSSLDCINTDICLGFDVETYLKYAEAVGLAPSPAGIP